MSAGTANKSNIEPGTATTKRRGCLFLLGRGLKWFAIALVALVILGFGYQTIATEIDKRTYTPRGELYSVNGHQMHIVCQGERQPGQPAVILQAGGAADSYYWYWVQQQLAPQTQVCAYDRAGMGWSESADSPRDPVTIVGELHVLLDAASVPAPYVMVGHSYGAILARVYTAQYPEEVTGLTLVDSYPADIVDQSLIDEQRPMYYAANAPMWLMFRLGIVRFIMPGQMQEMGFPPQIATEMAVIRSHNNVLDTDIAEKGLDNHLVLARASMEAEDLGALPLAVLWASESYANYDQDFMTEVAAYSSNSVTRVIPDSNHGSILGTEQKAQQVSDAILDVMQAMQTGEPLAQ